MVDNACWLVQLLGLTCLSDPISKFNENPIWLLLEANSRVAMVREKYLENEIFSGQGILLMAWRKDLESQGKVREFENKWLWQAVFRKFINSVQEGKGCTFSRDSLSPFPSSFLKERICSLGEQILSYKSTPNLK